MNSRQLDRQMDELERDLENGAISQRDYDMQMKEIQADYREAAREAAGEAYDREMDRW